MKFSYLCSWTIWKNPSLSLSCMCDYFENSAINMDLITTNVQTTNEIIPDLSFLLLFYIVQMNSEIHQFVDVPFNLRRSFWIRRIDVELVGITWIWNFHMNFTYSLEKNVRNSELIHSPLFEELLFSTCNFFHCSAYDNEFDSNFIQSTSLNNSKKNTSIDSLKLCHNLSLPIDVDWKEISTS